MIGEACVLYGCVAREGLILAQHTAAQQSNAAEIAKLVLQKIARDESQKLTYVYGDHLVHYATHRDGITYLCITKSSTNRMVAFALLAAFQQAFETGYTAEERLTAPRLSSFNEQIAKLMAWAESGAPSSGADKTSQVRGEIDAVKDVMVQNIERVLERGERIELLVDKTDGLSQAAFAFRKRSTALRRRMWWKNTVNKDKKIGKWTLPDRIARN